MAQFEQAVVNDIFDPDLKLDMILNPVNCKGVSGKGLAKEFAQRFPASQQNYKSVCQRTVYSPDATGRRRKVSLFQPGDVLHYIDTDLRRVDIFDTDRPIEEVQEDLKANTQHVIYIPTKNHWKRPSRLEYVQSGLKGLAKILREDESVREEVSRIGIPALGCGLGGLNPEDVMEVVYNTFLEVDEGIDADYTFVVFDPLTL